MNATVPKRRRLLQLLALLPAGARAAVEYPAVRKSIALQFPADEAAHPSFRSEWWYVTGWLNDEMRREIGFQLTFFRSRPGIAEDSTSAFAPRQLLFAHAAIADPAVGRLQLDQRAAREGFGLARAATASLDVRIDDWSLVLTRDRYDASVRARTFAFDLALAARTPILLQGDDGVSRKGVDPDDASFYYSRPHVDVTGALTTNGRTSDVRGTAWLDHEWSSHYLSHDAVGWDWTGINFDDGSALMAFRIRDASGAATWAGGAYRDASGARHAFAPSEVAFAPQRHWRSPRTGFSYPVSFRLRAGATDVLLEPLFDDQELDARAGVGIVYWEGAVRASVAGRVVGRGYLELTGYGSPLRL